MPQDTQSPYPQPPEQPQQPQPPQPQQPATGRAVSPKPPLEQGSAAEAPGRAASPRPPLEQGSAAEAPGRAASPMPPLQPQPQQPWHPQPQQPWQPQPQQPAPPVAPASPAPDLTPAGLKRTINRVCLTYAGFMVAVLFVGMALVLAIETAMVLAGNESAASDVSALDDIQDFPSFQHGQQSQQGQDTGIDVPASLTSIAQIASVAIGATLFFALRGKRFLTSDLRARRQRPKAATILMLFALALGIQFFLMILNAMISPFLDQVGLSLTDAMDEGTSTLSVDVIGLLYIIILGPVLEELVFRGAIRRALEPYGANFAIVASSILFGLYHIILFQAVFAFLLGLVLAYTAGRFSLKWAMLLHIANNALATSNILFAPVVGEAVMNVTIFLLFVAGFVATIVILVRKRKVLVAQKAVGAPAVPGPFRTFFSRPAFLVPAIVLVGFGLLLL